MSMPYHKELLRSSVSLCFREFFVFRNKAKGVMTLLCQFEKMIYPSGTGAADAASFMIALYRPCEKLKDSSGNTITQIKAVGYCLPTAGNMRYEMRGHWRKDPKYGIQYDVEGYEEQIIPTREGIIAYLSSGQIKGIGPKMAERIYDAFGNMALEVLDKKPEKLLTISGISQNKLKKICDSYLANRGARDVVAYGYEKSPEDKNKLVVDVYAAEVVRDIFGWKLSGINQDAIARRLNEQGILSPLEYKRSKGLPYKTSFKTKIKAQWTPVAVRRILTNPVYVGTLVQGIRTRPNYKIKTVIVNEQDKWAIYENAHEAIINPRQFVLVQRLLELDTRTSPRENGLFPLAGLLCCGDCGGAMVRKTQTSGNKRFCYYTCGNHKNTGECTSHRISQKQLEDAVLRLLQEHIRVLAELDGCLQTIRNAPVHRLSIRKAEDRLAAVEADIDRYRKLKISAYEDMRDGILSKEDYLDIKEQYEMRISEAQLAEEQVRHEINLYIENGNAPQRWIQEFLDHRNIQSLTRIVAVECIDHIMIYEGKRIEVTFAHMQAYEALVSRMKDYYINQREVG